ncbi:MAG TPA: peptidase M54 [Methanocorpusculum sp.]|nr:peptidase M54 [Methanocorpusculum sp.]
MGVHIFWDSRAPKGIAVPVTEGLSTILNMPVSRIDNGTFPLEGYDHIRKQYDAVKLLLKLDRFRSLHPDLFRPFGNSEVPYPMNPVDGEKVLLITSGDLYTACDSYVFGLAHPKFGVAVVSSTRLDNAFYNRHPDDFMLIKRIVTESSHEIAHLYGMEHCENLNCIMSCPNSLDYLDRKETYFCAKCRTELNQRIAGEGGY